MFKVKKSIFCICKVSLDVYIHMFMSDLTPRSIHTLHEYVDVWPSVDMISNITAMLTQSLTAIINLSSM